MAKHSKRHGNHEEHTDESWLIPYADLLTLLLALFIVLFASSKMDAKKFDQMVRSFDVALNGGIGVFNQPSPVPLDPSLPQQTLHMGKETDDKEKTEEEKKMEEAIRKETEDLKKLQQRMEDYIKANNLGDKLQTQLTDEGLLITILDNALFDSGKADLKPEARKLAAEMASMLVPHPKKVTVTLPYGQRSDPSCRISVQLGSQREALRQLFEGPARKQQFGPVQVQRDGNGRVPSGGIQCDTGGKSEKQARRGGDPA